MLRRSALVDHALYYDTEVPYVEDFELWHRILRRTRGANLREALVEHRQHDRSISALHQQEQWNAATEVSARQIRDLVSQTMISDHEIGNLRRLYRGTLPGSGHVILKLYRRMLMLLRRLIAKNDAKATDLAGVQHHLLMKIGRELQHATLKDVSRSVILPDLLKTRIHWELHLVAKSLVRHLRCGPGAKSEEQATT